MELALCYEVTIMLKQEKASPHCCLKYDCRLQLNWSPVQTMKNSPRATIHKVLLVIWFES